MKSFLFLLNTLYNEILSLFLFLLGRFSGEFGDHYTRSCNIKRMKGLDFKETAANGYAPYFEYAMDYGPVATTDEKNTGCLTSTVNSNSVNSATLPHYTNPLLNPNVNSNTSLPRSRNDPQQQVMGVSNNGFLGNMKNRTIALYIYHTIIIHYILQVNHYFRMVSIVVLEPCTVIHTFVLEVLRCHRYHRPVQLIRRRHRHHRPIMPPEIMVHIRMY